MDRIKIGVPGSYREADMVGSALKAENYEPVVSRNIHVRTFENVLTVFAVDTG